MSSQQAPYKVSIIVPTYNRATLLPTCIKSIQEQTYNNWELIIVDDGSTDGTVDYLNKLADPRISLLSIQHCGNLATLRNAGLSKATGEFIAFNDSDDLWDPKKLELQMKAMLNHEEAGFCLTNGYTCFDLDEPLHYFYKEKQSQLPEDLFYRCFQSKVSCFVQSLLIRRSCLETTGFFEEEGNADRQFIVLLAFHFKGVILNEPLVFRMMHQNNISHSKWMRQYQNEIDLIKKLRPLLPAAIVKDAMFRVYISFGEDYLLNHEKKQAARMFVKAALTRPFSFVPVKKLGKTLLHSR